MRKWRKRATTTRLTRATACPATGLVRTMVDHAAKLRANVVSVRIGGKDQYIVFNERNEKAVRLAIAMKNMDAMELDRFTRGAAWITCWFASVNTQYNPVFGVMNLARDLQGAMLQLSTTPLAGKQAKVFRNIRRNTRSIYKDLRASAGRRAPAQANGPSCGSICSWAAAPPATVTCTPIPRTAPRHCRGRWTRWAQGGWQRPRTAGLAVGLP